LTFLKAVRRREPGDTQPPLATSYYFFFAFFAAFFFAFFFAAIIVSFKVNLGMHVRVVGNFYSHSIARFFERCVLLFFHRSPEKISEKPCVVRQFYATAQKKSNTFVNRI
jgi:hypothetical protein